MGSLRPAWDDFVAAFGETWAYLLAFPTGTALRLWFGVVVLVALATLVRAVVRRSTLEVLWPLLWVVIALLFYGLSVWASGTPAEWFGFVASLMMLVAFFWGIINVGRAFARK